MENDFVPDYFVHQRAIVEPGATIGARTRIWAFAHILPGAVVGTDCNICDHVFIENRVKLGDRVTVKSGVQIWDEIVIEDDVFIGPNATFTNDNFPRSKQYPDGYAKTLIRRGASIGANATILAGIVVGANAMIGAGAVVTRDVPPNAIVKGNPARITGYVSSIVKGHLEVSTTRQSLKDSRIPGVRILEMPSVIDLRGTLTYGEYEQHLPFLPKRYFIISEVPGKEVRGEQAHQTLRQVLICVKGSCAVVVDNGAHREEFLLDSPALGLYIPPMIWITHYKYSEDAALLVLASEIYDPADYIREYTEFLKAVGQS
ncbi:MAG: WxcM-like domain-containing protein [Acidobacteriota bacterium]